MKLHYNTEAGVAISLSRRNLEHLLEALDREDKEDFPVHPYLIRETEDGTTLRVHAEEDTHHYGDREPGPGFEHLMDGESP